MTILTINLKVEVFSTHGVHVFISTHNVGNRRWKNEIMNGNRTKHFVFVTDIILNYRCTADKERIDINIDIEAVSVNSSRMLGQRSCFLLLLGFGGILQGVGAVRAVPRSKGEPILTRVQSMRPREHSTRQNNVQISQTHRRVPKGR